MEANVNIEPGRKASYKCIEMQMSEVPINNGKEGEGAVRAVGGCRQEHSHICGGTFLMSRKRVISSELHAWKCMEKNLYCFYFSFQAPYKTHLLSNWLMPKRWPRRHWAFRQLCPRIYNCMSTITPCLLSWPSADAWECLWCDIQWQTGLMGQIISFPQAGIVFVVYCWCVCVCTRVHLLNLYINIFIFNYMIRRYANLLFSETHFKLHFSLRLTYKK